MNKCAICGKTRDLMTLEFKPDETDDGVSWNSKVCGTCWDHIAVIARRAVWPEFEAMWIKIKQLEARVIK